jgi:hypothetical protein
LIDHADLDAERRAALAAEIGDHATLERVVRWGVARGRMISRVVKQDEYTEDVVLPYGDGLWLAYDST